MSKQAKTQESNQAEIDTRIVSIRTSQTMNKSQKIRAFHDLGLEKSEIAKIMNIRYQFVRNVLNQPLKKS